MRRQDDPRQTTLFGAPVLDDLVPRTHPLRKVRASSEATLRFLQARLELDDRRRRGAGPPADQVLRALLLWAVYGLPSERRLLEDLEFHLLYRWFVAIDPALPLWSRSGFLRARHRLVRSGLAGEYLGGVLTRVGPRTLANPRFALDRELVATLSGQQRI